VFMNEGYPHCSNGRLELGRFHQRCLNNGGRINNLGFNASFDIKCSALDAKRALLRTQRGYLQQ